MAQKSELEVSHHVDKDTIAKEITNYLSIDNQKNNLIEKDEISENLLGLVTGHGGNLKYDMQ